MNITSKLDIDTNDLIKVKSNSFVNSILVIHFLMLEEGFKFYKKAEGKCLKNYDINDFKVDLNQKNSCSIIYIIPTESFSFFPEVITLIAKVDENNERIIIEIKQDGNLNESIYYFDFIYDEISQIQNDLLLNLKSKLRSGILSNIKGFKPKFNKDDNNLFSKDSFVESSDIKFETFYKNDNSNQNKYSLKYEPQINNNSFNNINGNFNLTNEKGINTSSLNTEKNFFQSKNNGDNLFFKDSYNGTSGNLVGPDSEIFKGRINSNISKENRGFGNNGININNIGFPYIRKDIVGPLGYDGEIPNDEYDIFCNPDLRGINPKSLNLGNKKGNSNFNDIFPKGM